MTIQGIIDTIEYYIGCNSYENALALSEDRLETIAVHVDYSPSVLDTNLSVKSFYTLCRIFLIKKEYSLCIKAALKVIEKKPGLILDDDKNLYNRFIVNRLMDSLVENRNDVLEKFIIEFLSKQTPSLSLVGYLTDINSLEYGRSVFKKCLETKDESTVTNFINLCKTTNKQFYNEYIEIILEFMQDIQTRELAYHVIDYLVSLDQQTRLLEFIEGLRYPVGYEAANYIYMTYRLPLKSRNDELNAILSGEKQQEMISRFMIEENETNFQLLESMAKASTVHFGFCHSIMNAHTMNDTFFRSNRLPRGNQWSRFLDLGGLGLVYHHSSFEGIEEFLPGDERSGESSSFLSLGLIAMNSKHYTKDHEVLMKETEGFLRNFIDTNVAGDFFGTAIGLGSMKIGQGDLDLCNKLLQYLDSEDTIFQETTAYAIGMICAGTNDPSIVSQLVHLCNYTSFVRGKKAIAMSIGFIQDPLTMKNSLHVPQGNKGSKLLGVSQPDDEEGKEEHLEEEEELLSKLVGFGIHYANTQKAEIIEEILCELGRSKDYLRRQAVIALSLVVGYDEKLVEELVLPLVNNQNLWVRSTVSVCLGFFSIGFVSDEIIEKIIKALEALLYDDERLVVQGACIGLGFALQQYYETFDVSEDTSKEDVKTYTAVDHVRIVSKINSLLGCRMESKCVRFGASIGRSLMDVGGKNAITTIMTSDNRNVSFERVVCFSMFMNYWNWYPFINFISPLVQPTPYFLLDKDLQQSKKKPGFEICRLERTIFVREQRRQRSFRKSKSTEEIKNLISFNYGEFSSGKNLKLRERKRLRRQMFEFVDE